MKKIILILSVLALLVSGYASVKTNDTETTAKTEETSDFIEYDKLKKKSGIYYLNNVPFTGKAKKVDETSDETWEMKDGKFHGKYFGDEPNGSVTGYYKDGKKHGEWEEFHEPYDTYNKKIETYKEGKKHGEWKYFRVEQRWINDEELKFIDHLIKTEIWENDKLISGMSNLDGIKLAYVEGNGSIKGFYIGTFEVTQAQWEAVMGYNPSGFKGDNLPVENVSWDDVQEFLKKLNAKTGRNYRLPTEAQWEYAAKGGTNNNKYEYAGSDNIDDVAWYGDNSDDRTHTVGTKKPNSLGIYDMTGNVLEWCQDLWSNEGSIRVIRGGGWNYVASYCRVACRYDFSPDDYDYYLGFRLVLLP